MGDWYVPVKNRTPRGYKFYGVINGRNGFTGIVLSDLERRQVTDKVPFAQSKGFHTYREAQQFVDQSLDQEVVKRDGSIEEMVENTRKYINQLIKLII